MAIQVSLHPVAAQHSIQRLGTAAVQAPPEGYVGVQGGAEGVMAVGEEDRSAPSGPVASSVSFKVCW